MTSCLVAESCNQLKVMLWARDILRSRLKRLPKTCLQLMGKEMLSSRMSGFKRNSSASIKDHMVETCWWLGRSWIPHMWQIIAREEICPE